MAFLLRQTGIVLVLGLFIFCSSCEKHPLGEWPEVQREQVDPGKKAWSNDIKTDSTESAGSATPAEFFPSSTRP